MRDHICHVSYEGQACLKRLQSGKLDCWKGDCAMNLLLNMLQIVNWSVWCVCVCVRECLSSPQSDGPRPATYDWKPLWAGLGDNKISQPLLSRVGHFADLEGWIYNISRENPIIWDHSFLVLVFEAHGPDERPVVRFSARPSLTCCSWRCLDEKQCPFQVVPVFFRPQISNLVEFLSLSGAVANRGQSKQRIRKCGTLRPPWSISTLEASWNRHVGSKLRKQWCGLHMLRLVHHTEGRWYHWYGITQIWIFEWDWIGIQSNGQLCHPLKLRELEDILHFVSFCTNWFPSQCVVIVLHFFMKSIWKKQKWELFRPQEEVIWMVVWTLKRGGRAWTTVHETSNENWFLVLDLATSFKKFNLRTKKHTWAQCNQSVYIYIYT